MAVKTWLVFLVAVTSVTGILSSFDSPPEKFVVNLDLPADQRWTHVVTKQPYVDLIPKFRQVIGGMLPEPEVLLPLVEAIAADLDSYIKSPYAQEMRGIAKSLNMNLGDIVGANLLYDVSAFCTSIVMQDDKNMIWHARNLDFSFTDLLRNITVFIDFQRNNQTVYSGVTYAGYIGLMTGQRPKVFTITADERDDGSFWMNFLVGILQRDAVPVSFLIRDTLEESTNYQAAVNKLAYSITMASVYHIVAGVNPGEGVIITKGREEPVDIWPLNLSKNRWFEVETNYDHWNSPPPDDDRRDPAIKAMTNLGQKNISKATLFNVMSTVPIRNNHTTYSVVMSAAQPQIMQAWIRHGDVY
ncbi:N-acylethanolamine-hydrolyzing acid amidase [Mizuhopecten yessoensis]|uniref:N-acylethanolamine-hydrolyzing acid amidase n=2 Tax=Mizuhopecten yessoensis TaxID=6573 RepID=A0A210Q7K3_MIZYE|nr:N-acylethanolamine-hydrolyzing acid amidase [Mizuhopecten yessoensis]